MAALKLTKLFLPQSSANHSDTQDECQCINEETMQNNTVRLSPISNTNVIILIVDNGCKFEYILKAIWQSQPSTSAHAEVDYYHGVVGLLRFLFHSLHIL